MSLSAQLLMLPQWMAVSLLVVIAVSFSIVGFSRFTTSYRLKSDKFTMMWQVLFLRH